MSRIQFAIVALSAVLTMPAFSVAADGDRAVAAQVAAGDTAMARLDLSAATKAYTQALHDEPKSYEAAWRLARAYADSATLSPGAQQQERLCRQAETAARAAVALRPDGAKGHAFLAVALGKLALFEGGKQKVRLSREIEVEAKKALEFDPKDDLAHHVLGVWNREVAGLSGFLRFFASTLYGKVPQGSLDQALNHLRTAATLRPDVIPHRVELGITLASAHKYPEAEKELEGALKMPTSWVTDDYYRAKAKKALADVKRRTH